MVEYGGGVEFLSLITKLWVILLEDGYTVHNAFFDRDFTEERL
jgi:hypothetical protein